MLYRYFLKLSYLGTNYNGWQIQQNTPNTIQQVLIEKISLLLGEKVDIVGCGRTDTGVHAKEYYAHFDTAKNDLHRDPRVWLFKLNNMLPKDIVVKQFIPVKPDASARFDAYSRTYKYYVSRTRDPFSIGRAAYIYGELDFDLMNKGAALLMDYSDFSCFSKSNTQVKNNNCTVNEAYWIRDGNMFVFTITANRFLRNMVRAIVGTLLMLGENKISLTEFKKIIENKNRSDAGYSVPAEGLYLVDVKYPNEIFL